MIKRKLAGIVLLTLISLSACKNEAKAYRTEGITALEKGDAEKALENFDLALEKSKGKVGTLQFDILAYKIEAEIHLGKLDEAEENLQNLETISTKNYTKLQDLIEAKKSIVSLDLARKEMDEAKEKGLGTDRELEYSEAIYLEKTGEWQNAYDAFSKYCSRYPDDAEAARELQFLESRVKVLGGNTLLSERAKKVGKRHPKYVRRKYRLKEESPKRH